MTRTKAPTSVNAPAKWIRRGARRMFPAIVVLCGIAVPSMALAQAGEVRGRVVDLIWGQPIPDASITLHAGPAENRRTMSDANGDFAFAGLSPGRYSVTAEADGYVARPGARRGFLTDAALESGVSPFGTGVSIDLTARPEWFSASVSSDDPVSEIRIVLARGGTISGHVLRRADATPVSRASVVLYRRVVVDGEEEWTPVRRIRTERDGSYRISPLVSEEYRVAVEDRRYVETYFRNSRFTRDRTSVRVPFGAEIDRIDIFVVDRPAAN